MIPAVVAGGAGATWVWRHQGDLMLRRPVNEWTFTHMGALLPKTVVPREGPVWELPVRPGALDPAYERRLAEWHVDTFTTSCVVLHRGEIVHECYPGRFARPGVRFQGFSLTKSVTSILIGIALAEGAIKSVEDPAVAYCPALARSAFEGPTIEHLLDMSGGSSANEDWTVADSSINRYERAVTGGGSVLDVALSLGREDTPGTVFNYSTIDTQVLGWVLEGATGMPLAQYAASRLWSRLGAEHDAYYFLTRARPRTALGGGSLNLSTRDLARVGLLMSHGGEVAGERIVPAVWVARSRGRDLPHLAVGALGESGMPHYGYSNQWWTLGGERRAFTGIGVFGQYLYVDPDADVVIAKTSAWPSADDDELDTVSITGMRDLVAHLEAP